MSLATADLPEDIAALRAFALACQGELKAAQLAVQVKALEIEKLRFQIAKLRRMQFGRSSERITRQIEQLEFQLEELETGEAEDIAGMEADESTAPIPQRKKPKRKPLPDHLPRHEVLHEPEADSVCTCPACGGSMGKLGEDVTEVLDYVPGHFQVFRHVRPKYACQACDVITQAPAPAMPAPRGRATPAMLAHLLVSKYRDHLPLYRQCEIYAREGLELERSTYAIGWDKPPGCWRRWSRRSAPMCSRQIRFTVTTQRSPYWRRGWAEPRLAGSGSMCATTDHSAAQPRRRPPTSTAPTAAPSTRRPTWRDSPACCRRMVMRGSRNSMVPRAPSLARLPKLPAGRTRAAASLTNGSIINRRPPNRR